MWLTALTGGLAGSILTLSGQGLVGWWKRPVIAIVFDNDEPGCRVRTPSLGGKTDYAYLRLKIENRGKTFAEGMAVCVTHIIYRAPGSGERFFTEEVFDLGLALSKCPVFDLASGAHRFVDLVDARHIDGEPEPELCFNFLISPVRLRDFGFSKGDYEMTVVTTARNAKS